jgi:hypothetical protein
MSECEIHRPPSVAAKSKDKSLEYGTYTIFTSRITSISVNRGVDPLIHVDGQ